MSQRQRSSPRTTLCVSKFLYDSCENDAACGKDHKLARALQDGLKLCPVADCKRMFDPNHVANCALCPPHFHHMNNRDKCTSKRCTRWFEINVGRCPGCAVVYKLPKDARLCLGGCGASLLGEYPNVVCDRCIRVGKGKTTPSPPSSPPATIVVVAPVKTVIPDVGANCGFCVDGCEKSARCEDCVLYYNGRQRCTHYYPDKQCLNTFVTGQNVSLHECVDCFHKKAAETNGGRAGKKTSRRGAVMAAAEEKSTDEVSVHTTSESDNDESTPPVDDVAANEPSHSLDVVIDISSPGGAGVGGGAVASPSEMPVERDAVGEPAVVLTLSEQRSRSRDNAASVAATPSQSDDGGSGGDEDHSLDPHPIPPLTHERYPTAGSPPPSQQPEQQEQQQQQQQFQPPPPQQHPPHYHHAPSSHGGGGYHNTPHFLPHHSPPPHHNTPSSPHYAQTSWFPSDHSSSVSTRGGYIPPLKRCTRDGCRTMIRADSVFSDCVSCSAFFNNLVRCQFTVGCNNWTSSSLRACMECHARNSQV